MDQVVEPQAEGNRAVARRGGKVAGGEAATEEHEPHRRWGGQGEAAKHVEARGHQGAVA